MISRRFGIIPFLVVSTCLVIATKPCAAQEFRVETLLYVDKSKDASSDNLTLFSNGAIYDFLPKEDPTKIVIFDSNHDKFYLLDVKREVKVVLEKFQLTDFTSRLKANKQLQEKAPFLFNPQFTESYDDQTKLLTLSNDRMTYEATGPKVVDVRQLATYRTFANWYARINSTNPHNFPPFARIELNEAMEKYSFIPTKVKLTIRPKGGFFARAIVLETEHVLYNQLTQSDRKRIERAQSYVTQFKDVPLSVYHELEEVAKK